METIDNALSTVFKNRYSSTLITLFLVLYSGLVAPKLPNFIVKLFDNPIFRILILSLIVYNGNKDPQFAIMIAVGFTVTMNMVSKQKLFEGFAGGLSEPEEMDTSEEPAEMDTTEEPAEIEEPAEMNTSEEPAEMDTMEEPAEMDTTEEPAEM